MTGVQTLRTQDTSDPRHFGPTKVRTQDTSAWPKCPDTSALVPKCLTDTSAPVQRHFSTRQSQYLQGRPITLHISLCKGLPVDSSYLKRLVALSLGGELKSLVFTISGCSAPCSTGRPSDWAEIFRRAWLQTDYRPTRERRATADQRICQYIGLIIIVYYYSLLRHKAATVKHTNITIRNAM